MVEELKNGKAASYWINDKKRIMMSGYPEPIDITADLQIIIDLGLQRKNAIKGSA